ncbi:TPA_asm: hypothetical protein [Monoraphidium MELD virus]|nr:TPA_asm: hypothetical protein [Monoraphidium MELD virus]
MLQERTGYASFTNFATQMHEAKHLNTSPKTLLNTFRKLVVVEAVLNAQPEPAAGEKKHLISLRAAEHLSTIHSHLNKGKVGAAKFADGARDVIQDLKRNVLDKPEETLVREYAKGWKEQLVSEESCIFCCLLAAPCFPPAGNAPLPLRVSRPRETRRHRSGFPARGKRAAAARVPLRVSRSRETRRCRSGFPARGKRAAAACVPLRVSRPRETRATAPGYPPAVNEPIASSLHRDRLANTGHRDQQWYREARRRHGRGHRRGHRRGH